MKDFDIEDWNADTYELVCYEFFEDGDSAMVDFTALTKEDLWRLKIMLDKFFREEN